MTPRLLPLLLLAFAAPAYAADPWVTYKGGDGPGKGKHLVLLAGDDEYHSEEAMPQLGKILAKHHGFDVTVYCRNHYYDDRAPEYQGVHRVFLPAPGGKNFESIVHSNLAMLHAALKGYDLVIVADPGNAPFGLPLWLRRIPTMRLAIPFDQVPFKHDRLAYGVYELPVSW